MAFKKTRVQNFILTVNRLFMSLIKKKLLKKFNIVGAPNLSTDRIRTVPRFKCYRLNANFSFKLALVLMLKRSGTVRLHYVQSKMDKIKVVLKIQNFFPLFFLSKNKNYQKMKKIHLRQNLGVFSFG
jgi:hypothetical protein